MKKIFLLVLPPALFLGSKSSKISVGAAYVYAHLESLGFHVKILNLTQHESWATVRSALSKLISSVDIVGFTGTSAHRGFLISMSKLSKELKSEVKTILGGPIAMAETDLSQYFDLVVDGPIESLQLEDFSQNGKIISPPLPNDLDLLCKPKRSILVESWGAKQPIICSRYCQFACTFCFNSLRMKREAFKRHSVKRVMEEINEIIVGGHRRISFQDETFICKASWTEELCEEIIRHPVSIKFDCRSRADKIDSDILGKLARAGCDSISFGIESGCQSMLDLMNKNTSVEQNEFALRLTKEFGIKTKAYILLGVPGETPQTIKTTKEWLAKNISFIDRLYVYMWIPFPGSVLFQKRGNLYEIVSNSSGSDSELLGETMYRSAWQNRATISTTSLSVEELEAGFRSIVEEWPELCRFE